MKAGTRGSQVALSAISFVPLLALAALVAKYAVNVPLYDQWGLVPYIRQMEGEQSLSLAELAAQHNEHRILVPRVLLLTLAKLTAWNTLVEVAVGLAFATGSFFVLRALIGRSFQGNAFVAAVLTALTAVLLFSPMQWENWLFGWQVGWLMTISGALVTIWVLAAAEGQSLSWVRLVGAIVLAGLTTYGVATGIWVWLAGLVVLLASDRTRWQMLAWVLSAAVTLSVYFYGYDSSPGPGPSTTLLPFEDVGRFLSYVGVYLGSPFAQNLDVAAVVGFLMPTALMVATVYLVVVRRVRLSLLAPWLALGAFATAAAAATATRRLSLGVEQGLSSRYSTVALLLAIATGVVATMAIGRLLEHKQALRRILGVMASVLALAILLAGWDRGEEAMGVHHDHLSSTRACLDRATSVSDACLVQTYPVPEHVWDGIEYLRRIGRAGF